MDGPHGAPNLPEYLLNRILAYGDSVALIDSSNGKQRTYKDVWGRSLEIGEKLKSQGVCPGTKIGVILENCLEYGEVILGVLGAGAIAALYPPAASKRELEHLISITEPKFVITKNLIENKRLGLELHPTVNLMTLEDLALREDHNEDEGQGSNGHNYMHLCPSELSDPAFLLSSSGSTGLPKAVILSHSSLIWSLGSTSRLLMEKDQPALGLMPFYHAYGLGLLLMALSQGAPLVIMKKYSVKDFTDTLIKYKITHLHIVSPLLVKLAGDSYPKKSLKTLRAIHTGAASISTKVQTMVLNKLNPGSRLYHSYGMTETTHIIAFGEARMDKPGSPGRILDFMRAKIVDKNGKDLPRGEKGELYLQGPILTAGYLNNPKATEETFTQNRWLKTGDLAYIDSDGYLFIVDRIKDIIKFQGYQVSATELEQVILEKTGVSQVAVIGVEHETYGEVPKAFVVVQNDSGITEEEIEKHVEGQLSHYKWLRGGVKFLNDLPKTPSMKINKKLLKSQNIKNYRE